jgi:hypothetical protein
MQASVEGGLSEDAIKRIRELADGADLRVTSPATRRLPDDADKRIRAMPTGIQTSSQPLKSIALEQQSLKDQSIDTADVRRLLESFEELWDTIQPREQVRLVKLLIDRVDFDGVAGNVAITFHDTGLKSLSADQREVTA